MVQFIATVLKSKKLKGLKNPCKKEGTFRENYKKNHFPLDVSWD